MIAFLGLLVVVLFVVWLVLPDPENGRWVKKQRENELTHRDIHIERVMRHNYRRELTNANKVKYGKRRSL